MNIQMIKSDVEIWNNVKNSDERSFDLLFRRYFDMLCMYANGILKNEEASEEVVNDVFLRIWQKRDHIQIIHGIKPYLFRSVYNASADYIVQKSTMQHYHIEIDDRIKEITGSNDEYIFNYLQGEVVEKEIMEAIEELPKQCREVFCLSRFELLTYHEISERLNISVNTVKTQISRAMDNLRKQLEKYL